MTLEPAYLAGVFDSDGSFTLSHHSRPTVRLGFDYRVYLQLTWKALPQTIMVMKELKEKYGGSLVFGSENSGFSRHTRYVKYRVNALKARRLIEDMLPYLRIKRRQAEICFEVSSGAQREHYGRWHPRSAAELTRLGELYNEMALLNWKNGKGRGKQLTRSQFISPVPK